MGTPEAPAIAETVGEGVEDDIFEKVVQATVFWVQALTAMMK